VLPGPLTGLVLGVLALGPGLRRGFLLTHDMVFVPREPFAAALPGLAPPRAVPSDLVIATASRVLPGDLVQKVVLLGIFVLACAGVVALLDREPLLARLAAGVFYTWNPYVAERLLIGQWALLLGYAALPWVLRATLRLEPLSRRTVARLALALLPAAIGGFAGTVLCALVVLPAVLLTRNVRTAAVALGALLAGGLPWLIPSLLHAVYVDPASVAAFAARPDTPFGSVGSLLMLGGIWNAGTIPKAYGGPWSALWLGVVLVALAGFVVSVRRDPRWRALAISAVAGLLIACAGVTAPGRDALRSLIAAFPGAAMFRDAQQYVAPLALAEACGMGVVVAWVLKPRTFDSAGLIFGVVALLAPVLLLPGLAWGGAGRLRPAAYPASWLAAARTIDDSPAPGGVLLLPWETYRTPSWNHGQVVLDPWTRLLPRPLIWNDGTRVGTVELAPDDPVARGLDGAIRGTGPLTARLRAAGVRFVLDDVAGDPVQPRLPGAVVFIREPGLVVYRLPG
jgi:hypothetical protein